MDEIKNNLIKHVIHCIKQAEIENSKLTNEILQIEGLSSSKVRHLLNNICSLKDGRYLEIGLWKGSTFISALFENQNNLSMAFGIDKWWQFQDEKDVFFKNANKFLRSDRYQIIEADAFNINLEDFFEKKSINIYFYDGNHSLKAQELAFECYNDIFQDVFIVIVDDYNKDNVQRGTRNAFKKLGYNILYEKILPSNYEHDKNNWWNGVYIAVVSKK